MCDLRRPARSAPRGKDKTRPASSRASPCAQGGGRTLLFSAYPYPVGVCPSRTNCIHSTPFCPFVYRPWFDCHEAQQTINGQRIVTKTCSAILDLNYIKYIECTPSFSAGHPMEVSKYRKHRPTMTVSAEDPVNFTSPCRVAFASDGAWADQNRGNRLSPVYNM